MPVLIDKIKAPNLLLNILIEIYTIKRRSQVPIYSNKKETIADFLIAKSAASSFLFRVRQQGIA